MPPSASGTTSRNSTGASSGADSNLQAQHAHFLFITNAAGAVVSTTDNEARYYTNDKGLVTRDRQLKKDAFYMYKAKWNKQEETVYISSRRLKKIPASLAYQVKVYSNAKTLTLYQDDKKIETLEGSGEITGVIWKFKPVKLGGKQSTFKVVSDSGKEDQITLEAL